MFKTNNQENEQLDRAGRSILSAAVADESETEAAASAPFLFTRVRAAIAETRRQEQSGNWLSLIVVARRAVPAMALVAILAALLTIWSAPLNAPSMAGQLDDEALFGAADPGVEQTVLTSRNGLSRDEVINIVVDRNYGVNAR